jgi:hypothetical protein
MNIGSSNRLSYDPDTYSDRVQESTAPLMYNMDINANVNCNVCIPQKTTLKSTGFLLNNNFPNLIDTETVLTNRNMVASNSRMGEMNTYDMSKLKKDNPQNLCPDQYIPIQSRFEMPPVTSKDVLVDRFIDLPKNPQQNLFWNFAVNTQLEAKDNYIPRKQKLVDPYLALPTKKPSNYGCGYGSCGTK